MLPFSVQMGLGGVVVSYPDQPSRLSVPEPEPDRKKSRVVSVAVFTMSFLIVIGIIVAVTHSGGGGSSATDPAAQVSQSDAPQSDPAAAHKWYVNGGETRMTAVTRDLGAIADDESANDLTSMADDCTTLQTDVQDGQAYGPAPDEVVQEHWSSALDSLAQAAADCADGITNSNSVQIESSHQGIKDGTTELRLATSRANSFSAPQG